MLLSIKHDQKDIGINCFFVFMHFYLNRSSKSSSFNSAETAFVNCCFLSCMNCIVFFLTKDDKCFSASVQQDQDMSGIIPTCDYTGPIILTLTIATATSYKKYAQIFFCKIYILFKQDPEKSTCKNILFNLISNL